MLSLLAGVPFLHQAFHVDDPNFLALARHASPDPLRLYDFSINWRGTNEVAFDILSNPPLVPWYLAAVAAVAGGREWVFRLAFWPFVALALVGMARLGRRFVGPEGAVWTMFWSAVTPAFVLASHSVMPDIPLLAAYVVGIALAIEGLDRGSERRALAGGVFAGLSALCRYSGATAIAVLALYIVLHRRRGKPAVWALVGAAAPLIVWSCVSQIVYGRVHVLTIAGFQTSATGLAAIVLNASYGVAAIGLTVVPAALVGGVLEARGRLVSARAWRAALLAGLTGGSVAAILRQPLSAIGLAMVGVMAGWLVVGLAVTAVRASLTGKTRGDGGGETSDGAFLACWLLGMLAFNLPLGLASVRYLLLALPAAVLLVQRALTWRPSWIARTVAGLAVLAVSLVISRADADLANGYRDYAAALPLPARTRWFVGHWGLQHYLEATGARPLSAAEWSLLRPGDEIIVPTYAWPQALPANVETRLLSETKVPGRFWLRTVTLEGRACFYANWIAPRTTPVLLPFGFSNGPHEVLTRLEVIRLR